MLVGLHEMVWHGLNSMLPLLELHVFWCSVPVELPEDKEKMRSCSQPLLSAFLEIGFIPHMLYTLHVLTIFISSGCL